MKCKTIRTSLSLSEIERWLKDGDWRVRQAAMNACAGRSAFLCMTARLVTS